jgi:hypothetical protein
MGSRTALIIIGTFKDEWWGLAPVAQANFVEQVGKITSAAGLSPLTGYRLAATPGAFLEVWEGANQAAVERAVNDLTSMGYTHYVEARWLIGERQIQGNGDRRSSAQDASRRAPQPSSAQEPPRDVRPQRSSVVRRRSSTSRR